MKAKYTPLFEQWWKAYPRKTAKTTAFKAWLKQGIEDDAFMPKQAIADCEKRTRLGWWPRDVSKIPHGATWINQMRWEDEGWEDEIKTREDGKPNTGLPMPRPRDDGPMLSSWELMVNRLMRNYLFKAGGFTKEQLAIFQKAKRDVMQQFIPAINEEIAAADSDEAKRAAKTEMAWMLAHTLMNRLDHDLCKNLGPLVIKMGRAA
jgi:hypothetical protein